MKIIIYGAGEIGSLIAKEYYQAHDITIIDSINNKVDDINKLDVSFVNCQAITIDALKDAGIKSADAFISCTQNDELNILACLTAKRICDVNTICFVSKEEYKSSLALTKDNEHPCSVYIDHLIWPEEMLTKEIFQIVSIEKALDAESFANGKAKLIEYKLEENSILVGKKVKECDFPSEVLIVGITKDDDLCNPNGETVLEVGDKLIFMGLAQSLSILAAKFFHEKNYKKSIAIIGGGSVGLMLAKSLEKTKVQVKIIEKDINRCEFLAEELSNALIINGDATNLELLTQEEIGQMDAIISITDNDEKNLLCGLLSKQLGVPRVIARVSQVLHIPLFEKVGIDIALSPKSAALHEVKNSLQGNSNVGILTTVEQGKGEVLEIKVADGFNEIKLMDLKLPRRAIIGIIHRNNRVIIPKGDTLIRENDDLIIFTTKENAPVIKEFFKVK